MSRFFSLAEAVRNDLNDDAASLIVASEAAARKHHLTPNARILGGAAAGIPPRVMGIGPIRAALELRLTGKRLALATMCIGVGQGIAVGLEAV